MAVRQVSEECLACLQQDIETAHYYGEAVMIAPSVLRKLIAEITYYRACDGVAKEAA